MSSSSTFWLLEWLFSLPNNGDSRLERGARSWGVRGPRVEPRLRAIDDSEAPFVLHQVGTNVGNVEYARTTERTMK